MLLRLKITVYNIAVRPPGILKGSLDHDLYALIRAVGLYYSLVPLLRRSPKYLFRSFAPPLLHRTLVTLTDQSSLLARPPSMREALS